MFNLSKVAKITGFTELPISEAQSLWKSYLEYLDKHDGKDIIDMPNLDLNFGNG